MWEEVALFVAVGFAAQIVDGAIGMAYGVTATSFLLGFGIPPATASACVHASEVFTTGISGFSHWKFGNVKREIVWRLAIPGMAGGAVGAYILTVVPGEVLKPYVSVYLLCMGIVIIWKARRTVEADDGHAHRQLEPLGVFGGFLDAAGGGGWGPIVTSTLVGRGGTPRYIVGSVNLAEFFVTAVITGTFLLTIGLELWPIIAGLVLGGALAAPLAAMVTRKVPARPMMFLIGTVIVILSARGLATLFI